MPKLKKSLSATLERTLWELNSASLRYAIVEEDFISIIRVVSGKQLWHNWALWYQETLRFLNW